MKMKSILWLAFFLLISVLPAPAQELAISPSGLVQAGTVLHFSAKLKYGDVPCDGTPMIIYWYVQFMSDNYWRSDNIVPPLNTGFQWYNFNATYTVTAADVNNPDFCFELVACSFCWPFDHPYLETRSCPMTKTSIPRFHLEKYIECWRVPGCPGCLKLDLGQLIRTLGDPLERLQVVLLRNGQQIALLGEAGRGRKLPAQVQITLPEARQGLSRARQADVFQLQVLGKNGQVLSSQEVTLKLK